MIDFTLTLLSRKESEIYLNGELNDNGCINENWMLNSKMASSDLD